MRSYIFRTITAILLFAYCISIMAINLDSFSEKKRNKLLLSMAKEVVLRYGPDFYRDDSVSIKKRLNNLYSVESEPNFVVYFNSDGLPDGVLFYKGLGVFVTDVYKSYLAQKYYDINKNNGIDYKKLIDDEVVEPIKYPKKLEIKKINESEKSGTNLRYLLRPWRDSTGSLVVDTIYMPKKEEKPTFRRVLIDEKIIGKDTVRRYKAVPIND